MELKGKSALITGASSGLGRAIAIELGKEGAKVAVLARRQEQLAETAGLVDQAGGTGLAIPTDVTDPEQVSAAVERAAGELDGLDILVNNAGLGIFKRVEEMSIEEWDRQINVMIRGAFLVSHYALPHLYRREAGHVINVSSLWAIRFCPTCAAYTAAKFGVRGFTQSLREEAREHNVRVTNIMPGTVATEFFDKSNWSTDTSAALRDEDIAATALFALKLPDHAVMEEVTLQAIHPPGGSA
jgi:NADP-dependent 3-hydroxy acid dehydrogenase YdfG